MSHIALYRKYRPHTFEDVKGQDQAVSYLKSIIASKRVPHALLLTGSRGIGKTTLARIFARELGVHPHDIYEIDAASNNGVDEIRQLREEVNTLPMNSPYKVYILDEVHMLSKAAFNAFLKTLEEPPAHVIFVLATTELHKVLPTVISRCQVVHLQKPTNNLLAEQIVNVANQESKEIPIEFATLIAERAQGSYRDALVLLDQILEQSTGGKTISQADIDAVGLRTIDHLVFQFLRQLSEKQQSELFETVAEISASHEKGVSEFLEKLIHIMRSVLYINHAPTLWDQMKSDYSEDQQQILQSLSDSGTITTATLARFLEVIEETKKSTIPAIPLELAIIEVLGNTAVNKSLF